MKKAAAVLAVVIMVVSLVSLVFAAEAKKGTIKGVVPDLICFAKYR